MATNHLTTELIGGIIRYSIVMVLILISFLNIFNANIQFMMSITLLILFVFSVTFIIRDILATTSLLTEANEILRLTSTSIYFRNFFLATIIIGVIFKIISLTLFIVVFNYGRNQLSNSNGTPSLTKDNSITFNTYIALFITSTIAMGLLLLMVFILYTSYETRVAMINISSTIISITILGICSIEMIYASRFFDIFKYKGVVYQTTT